MQKPIHIIMCIIVTMFLVMIFGLIHSMFLLPVILAYIGPQYENDANISTFQLNEQNGRPSYTK
jgi:hypothetical protein